MFEINTYPRNVQRDLRNMAESALRAAHIERSFDDERPAIEIMEQHGGLPAIGDAKAAMVAQILDFEQNAPVCADAARPDEV